MIGISHFQISSSKDNSQDIFQVQVEQVEGLKRYMRGVVGLFAMRQGQGLDRKPSLRGEEGLCLEPEETR